VTLAQIKANRKAKGCEDGCGVDCMVRTSLPFSNRWGVFATEAAERMRGLGRRVGLSARK
jgi:hypothetical protein